MFMRMWWKLLLLICAAFSLSAQQDHRQNIQRLAQAFEQQSEYERALQLYTELFAGDSVNMLYFDAVRRLNIQLKRFDAAVEISLQRLRWTPFDLTLHSSIAGIYAQAGRERQADSVWNLILFSANKNQMVYRAVANEQANQRLFDKAIATYLRGRRELGDPMIFANELGYLYSFMMDFSNATREYLGLLRQNEQQYDFVQSRINALITRTDGLSSAVAAVEEELRKKRTIPLLRLLVWLHMEGDRFAEAFRRTQEIESLVGSGGQELFNFAERVFKEKQYTIALEAYRMSLNAGAAMPFAPSARFGYARCIEELSATGEVGGSQDKSAAGQLETMADVSGAIQRYEELAKEFPRTNIGANAMYRIGWIRYYRLFDLDGALRVFDSLRTVSPAGPMIPMVLSTIGDLLIAQNKLSEASTAFRSVITSPYSSPEQRTFGQFRLAEIRFFDEQFDSTLFILKPLTENLRTDESNDALLLQYFITENRFQFPDAVRRFSRAELLARRNKLSEATAEFGSIIDLYPAAPMADDVLLKIAEYSLRQKQFAAAHQAYQRLLTEYAESSERERTMFLIGELYQFHLSDSAQAIAAYEKILELHPFSLFAEEARKRIRRLRGDAL